MNASRVRSELRKPLSARSPDSASIRATLHPLLRLQKTAGNRAVAGLHASGALQAKLTIGAPGDVYEEEADRVASQVMRQIGPGIGPFQSAGAGGVPIQRQPLEEEEELLQPRRASPVPAAVPTARADPPLSHTSEPIPTTVTGPSMPTVGGDVESQLAAGGGGGQVLDRGFRADLEGVFGYDFGGVRIHTGTLADELSGQLSAEAFTNRSDIYFRAGRYQPGTELGRFLLAHELTHVVQQGAAAPQVESNPGE